MDFLKLPIRTATFEALVGNEPGNYKATQRNLSTWGADAYVAQWQVRSQRRKEMGLCLPSTKNWTRQIDTKVPLQQPRWWGGSDGTTDDPNTVAIQTDLITSRSVIIDSTGVKSPRSDTTHP